MQYSSDSLGSMLQFTCTLTLHFIAVTPVPCLNNCSCYHRQDLGVNVYNCSHGSRFPTIVPDNTNWLLCSNSGITNLHDISNVENITKVNISNNNIQTIPEGIFSAFNNLTTLDISNNNFTSLSKELQHLDKLRAVYIAGNPIVCNCDMLWLISWMNSFLPNRTWIVPDYAEVKCSKTNQLIHKLTAVEMGCFPKQLTSWQIAILGVGGGILILVMITIIVVAKRWNEVKWFLFFHFNIRDKRDDDVNILKGMKWDAMISYR